MSFAPILAAPLIVKFHVVAVLAALVSGALQLVTPKGTYPHRVVGYFFVIALVLTCVTALFILDRPMAPNIGPVSWLHVLAVFTLYRVFVSVQAARNGDIRKHQDGMKAIIYFALGIPFLVALLVPGRILYKSLFGG